jgi:enediyne biosynthesis protein E4
VGPNRGGAWALGGILLALACDPDIGPGLDGTDTDSDTDPAADTDLPAEAPLAFVEVGVEAGLVHEHRPGLGLQDLPCGIADLTTGGVAADDVDDDGFTDLFFPVHGGPDRLYRNRGDGSFEDVTGAVGLGDPGPSTSGVFLDLDEDGRLDLVVGRLQGRPLLVYRQQPDGTFVEEAEAWGLTQRNREDGCGIVWGVSPGDVDVDGDLDLVMAAWNDKTGPGPRWGTVVWMREGDRFVPDFIDFPGPTWGFSGSVVDLDGDGQPEIPLTSDFGTNRLLRWDGARWVDVSGSARVSDVEAAMGSAILDLDGDLDWDWFITSVWDPRGPIDPFAPHTGNRAYLNAGDGTFTDGTADLGLLDTGWGWGIAELDAELDGDLDLVVANGWTRGEAASFLFEPFMADPTAVLLRDEAAAPPFQHAAESVGLLEDGQSRAIIAFDVENDGDLDVLSVEQMGRPRLWRNQIRTDRAWARLALSGPPGNPRGIGAELRVQVVPAGPVTLHRIHQDSSFLSQVPPAVHLGLGPHPGPIHRVEVHWPDGAVTTHEGVPVGRTVRLRR